MLTSQAFLNEVAQKGFAAIPSVQPVALSKPTNELTHVDSLIAIPQPDANGLFATPLDGALWMAMTWNIPQIPLKPNSKVPCISHWPSKATTDPNQIRAWWEQFGGNFGSVALNHIIFETDSPEVAQRYKAQGGKFTSPLIIVSAKGGHRYYLATPELTKTITQEDVEHRDFSVRIGAAYCVSAGSIHPSGKQYRVIVDSNCPGAPTVPTEQEIKFWLSEKKSTQDMQPTQAAQTVSSVLVETDEVKVPTHIWDGREIGEGGRNTQLHRIGSWYRNQDKDEDEICEFLTEINSQFCRPVLDDGEIALISHSAAGYDLPKPEPKLLFGGQPSKALTEPQQATEVDSLRVPAIKVELPPDPNSEASIPDFDPSVVNGIYRRIVELATRGTTQQPQFVYAVAKAIIGIRMAGKVTFENLDIEPRFYTALIGASGSGKGMAYRRCVDILHPKGSLVKDPSAPKYGCGIKILNSSDSGAGLKDFFFEEPADQPVLCYIDEVKTLGNKGKDTRNPDILDTMGELADSTTITRNLAKRSGGTKSKDDARLSIVMCGQNGDVYMSSFTGRTGIGWWDRLYPEYGVPQETGNTPPVDSIEAFELLQEINQLIEWGTGKVMSMTPEAEAYLDDFWKNQPPEVRKKARWRKNLFLDCYMSAFGSYRKTANLEDAQIAVKIVIRQLAIRRVCFREEVPDRVGHYTALIKRYTERMADHLKAGVPIGQVAMSRRDFERETHSYRDNEGQAFSRAWATFAPVWLTQVTVTGGNGQKYVKYLPAPPEE